LGNQKLTQIGVYAVRGFLTFFIVVVVAFFTAPCRLKAAPSFDCKAAATAVEFLICENQWLSRQDFELSVTCERLVELSASQPIDKEKLLQEQRQWLRSRPKICSVPGKTVPADESKKFEATVCLADLYKIREIALDQMMFRQADAPDLFSTTDIVRREELKKVTGDFQNSLMSLFEVKASKAVSCDNAIDLVAQGPGRDSSYGAHCKVHLNATTVNLLMCNDRMVGKFAIKLSSASPPRDEIVEFVHSVCPPGG
jgi:uncharacterized protein YecT (DUF1311 family)